MKRAAVVVCLLTLAALPSPAVLPVPTLPTFVEFESGPVRPVALSPSGSRLYVANIPDNRLEVFSVNPGGTLTHAFSIPVGMEPVAVAARTDTEIWVVNHLSDSVSIVDLAAAPPRVVRTLIVGDEPSDIVFAGSTGSCPSGCAFISTAHRGQQRTEGNIPATSFQPAGTNDPQLTTQGTPRADVWVFNTANLGTEVGGVPIRVQSFFADTPRALATDGTNVYVAAFHSGNQTTTVLEACVRDGFGAATLGPAPANCPAGTVTVPGGVPGPSTNRSGAGQAVAPETGVIVKYNGANWVDILGRSWSNAVRFNLPDRDVFAMNANTLATGTIFQHVGTILFNMVRNPVSGRIYVTNTESPNLTMFEGPGTYAASQAFCEQSPTDKACTVQGHLSESRITVLNPSTSGVDPQHLNKHIDYKLRHTTTGVNHSVIDGYKASSLATPLQPVVSSNGATLYVPAFGSGKIGVFSTAAIEDPNFETNFDPVAASANYITTTGGGPAGLALDEVNNRLYVLTRFNNTVNVIDLSTKATVATHPLFNPEPANVVTGRPFLYDAQQTSGNGEASCSSCHIFGDNDDLAWNLGNPDDTTATNPQPKPSVFLPAAPAFHPMKGPMTTQTLRGLFNHGGMHWRGDRTNGFFGQDPCNNSSPSNAACDEDLSFRNFIVAFEGLVGKQGTITNTQMQQFSDFMLQVLEPPNPNRQLNDTLVGSALAGQAAFFTCGGDPNTQVNCPPPDDANPDPIRTDTVEDCDGCHTLNPGLGLFGASGFESFEGEPQHAKVPHYRNLYTKVGMFSVGIPLGSDQVRGFGFLHDGGIDTLFSFHSAPVFALTNQQKLDLEQFGLQSYTDLAPIVGQQVTLTSTNGAVANPRIDLMIQRAAASFPSFMLGGTVTECDVIVKGVVGTNPRGWVREAGGSFRDNTNALWTDANVRALAATDGPLTYTCAPPGSGRRMGIDRDLNGTLDPLPEPGFALSLGSGLALLAALARRGRRISAR
jgi:DNA-binding beta-propeller fold protein YncE